VHWLIIGLALLKTIRCRKISSCTATKWCYLIFQDSVNVDSIVFLFLSAHTLHRAGIFKQSMGARNRVRIRLSYRSARARIGNLLRSPGFDSQPGGPVGQPYLTYRAAWAPWTFTNTGSDYMGWQGIDSLPP
jgi:hypothetical protein